MECDLTKATILQTFDDDAQAISYVRMKAHPLLEDAKDVPKAFMGGKFWKWFRYDRAGVTDKSQNKLVSALSNILYESIGRAGNVVRSKTMSQVKQFELNRLRVLYYRNFVVNYDRWLKENNFSRLKLENIKKRTEFNEHVARVIRGEKSDSEAVNKAAKHQQDLYKQMLKMAKKAGVRGADNVEENLNYLTRVYSWGKISRLISDKGYDEVVSFLTRALRGGVNEASNKKLVESLLTVIRKSRNQQGINIGQILNSRAEVLDRLLRESTELNGGEIKTILNQIFPVKGSGAAKPFRYRSLKLDETYTDGKMSVSDFLENDSELLFLNYANNITGKIALAERGFKTRHDWDAMMKQIDDEYDKNPNISDSTRKHEKKALQSGYDHLSGKPLEDDPSSGLSTFGRIMRKYNFTRIMNQVGMAQLAEIGVLVMNLGLSQTIRHLPELRRSLKRLRTGEDAGMMSDEFYREAETIFGGFGSERLINQVANQTEEFGSRLGSGRINKFERGLDHMGRLTADISGMTLINGIMKRIAMRGVVQKFVDEAFGGADALTSTRVWTKGRGAFKKTNQRYRDLGISDEMRERILKMIRKHTKTSDSTLSKRKVRKTNLEEWTDEEASSTFAHAVNRWGRRTIQENDIGEQMFLGGITDTWFGKVMFQFRGFMMTAYGKHLLHGIKMNDLQAYMGFMASGFFAGMSWVAQMHLQAAIMGKREKKKFLEQRFGKTDKEFVLNIAKAGFQRSAFASLLPATIDSGATMLGFSQFFHYRSTGLDSNVITGNPTYHMLWTKFASGAVPSTFKSMHDKDYDFSQKQYNDWTQLFVLQNAFGIQNVIRKFGETNLPKRP